MSYLGSSPSVPKKLSDFHLAFLFVFNRITGRVYIQVGGKELLRIIFFDESNKRNKTIEKDKRTGEWHTHYGYEHAEYSEIKHQPLTEADKKTLEKVNHIWSNRNRA